MTNGDDVQFEDGGGADVFAGPMAAPERADNSTTEPELDGQVRGLGAPDLRSAVEALLIVADEPLSEVDMATHTEQPVAVVAQCVAELAEEYAESGRGFELRHTGSGWRFYSSARCAEVVARYVTDGQNARLSQAAMETLAVVAYRQPVTRAHISAVRGVNVDGVVRTLIARGLIARVEVDPLTGAGLYGTTEYFLERLGLADLADLPPLAEHVPIGAELDELIDSQES